MTYKYYQKRPNSESAILSRFTTRFVLVGLLIANLVPFHDALTLTMMGARRRGKSGDLKKILVAGDSGSSSPATVTGTSGMPVQTISGTKSLNKGRGQEITGVTLPVQGALKGWEFGQNVRMVCANAGKNGRDSYYAIQGDCPRCGFDLWRGDLLIDDPAWEKEGLPRVACPTCSTTFHLRTGKSGPPLKRTGLQGFVSGLAKSATPANAGTDAKAFIITRDDIDGRVYCRER